jgi:hypothetical protein
MEYISSYSYYIQKLYHKFGFELIIRLEVMFQPNTKVVMFGVVGFVAHLRGNER